MQTFYFEMTDTFAGELNYCWLKKFEVKAKSLRSALIKISKETGYNFRYNGLFYKAKDACVGLYEMEHDFAQYKIEYQQWLADAKRII